MPVYTQFLLPKQQLFVCCCCFVFWPDDYRVTLNNRCCNWTTGRLIHRLVTTALMARSVPMYTTVFLTLLYEPFA